MNEEITTSIILEERTPKSDGTCPIKIRVTYRRAQRYYKTGFSLTKEDFLKAFRGNPKKELKTIKISLDAMEQKAVNIIDNLKPFSFYEFKEHYFGEKKLTGNDAFQYLDNRAAQLVSEKRIKSSECCISAKASLLKFYGKPVLPFEKITQSFLQEYEESMLGMSRSSTTIGIYLRELRAVIKKAIAEKKMQLSNYPFGEHKYQIPTGKNIKKALSTEKLVKVFEYKPKTADEEKAMAFWKFAYMCNGLNFKDIVLMKNRNVNGQNAHIDPSYGKARKKPLRSKLTPACAGY